MISRRPCFLEILTVLFRAAVTLVLYHVRYHFGSFCVCPFFPFASFIISELLILFIFHRNTSYIILSFFLFFTKLKTTVFIIENHYQIKIIA